MYNGAERRSEAAAGSSCTQVLVLREKRRGNGLTFGWTDKVWGHTNFLWPLLQAAVRLLNSILTTLYDQTEVSE